MDGVNQDGRRVASRRNVTAVKLSFLLGLDLPRFSGQFVTSLVFSLLLSSLCSRLPYLSHLRGLSLQAAEALWRICLPFGLTSTACKAPGAEFAPDPLAWVSPEFTGFDLFECVPLVIHR